MISSSTSFSVSGAEGDKISAARHNRERTRTKEFPSLWTHTVIPIPQHHSHTLHNETHLVRIRVHVGHHFVRHRTVMNGGTAEIDEVDAFRFSVKHDMVFKTWAKLTMFDVIDMDQLLNRLCDEIPCPYQPE